MVAYGAPCKPPPGMVTVAARTDPTPGLIRLLAVLAAINITHQLLEAERIRQQGEADVEQRALCLMESIEEQLKTTPARLAGPVRSN